MTKLIDSDTDADDRPVQIEVTEEMIEAGTRTLSSHNLTQDFSYDPKEVVREVFMDMWASKKSSC